MKVVIWIEVIQASIMFIGLILSIVIDIVDAGGISKVYKTVKVGNRLQFSVVDVDPLICYAMWNTKSTQKIAWTNYVMLVFMHILSLCVRCLLYNKYSQCDRLQTKIISRPDQMYPLFAIETSRRFSGYKSLCDC
ncbi:unnamed protein product, partial [Adineta steineri]